ncbi:MAG: coat protein [Cressdnaviricota sp.]|nr:MAG: coat protein [Cressdnaviricota sp.]
MPKYARPRKFTKRRYRRGRGRSRRSGSGFRRSVLAVVRSTREIKTSQRAGEVKLTTDIKGPDAISVGNLNGFFPQLFQDTTKRGRIGAKINALSLKVKFWVQYIPDANGTTSTDEGNVTARMFMIRQKNIGNYFNLVNNQALVQSPAFRESELLEGSAPNTTVPFMQSNLYRNIMNPLNRALFVSKMDHKFNLKSNTLFNGQNTNTPVLGPTNFKKFSKTFKWKNGKEMTFANAADSIPVAFPWVFTGGYVNTNGSVPTGGRLKVFYKSILKFTDA